MRSTLRYVLIPVAAVAVLAALAARGTTTARAGMLTIVTESSPAEPPAQRHRDSRMPFSDQETIRKSFDLGGAAASRIITVDNVNGSIEVVGTDSTQVQLVVNRTNKAKTQERLDEAKRDVTLEITHEAGALKLFVDGPFRCQRDGRKRDDCCCVNFHGDEGYRVNMDFQLQVPRETQITLRTVNGGDVTVREVRGRFSVHNVNGGIEMLGMAGSGEAQTVNGEVKVAFRENPREDSSFESVNGDIDLHFRNGLSADFRFKTFNGDIYSDFPVTSLPARGMETERKGGKTIFRADRFTGGRIGAGGIQVTVENLNGDIRIRENHE
jgi:hypothetical protein